MSAAVIGNASSSPSDCRLGGTSGALMITGSGPRLGSRPGLLGESAIETLVSLALRSLLRHAGTAHEL